MATFHLTASQQCALASIAETWRIAEVELFGSALGDAFSEESDVDLLVTFAPEARWSLLDMARIQEAVEAVVGRRVDLVSRRAIERSPNPIRRQAILGSARSLLAG